MIIIGLVKVDVHKSERPYSFLSFSDVDAIKGLIKYRSDLDKYYGISENNYFDEAGDTVDFNTEIIVTYLTLDEYINAIFAQLDMKDVILLSMFERGYSEKDISERIKISKKQVLIKFDAIANLIKDYNDKRFYDSMEMLHKWDKIKHNKKQTVAL